MEGASEVGMIDTIVSTLVLEVLYRVGKVAVKGPSSNLSLSLRNLEAE